jgi:serine protease Do
MSEVSSVNCPSCQQPVNSGARFCRNCGQPIKPIQPEADKPTGNRTNSSNRKVWAIASGAAVMAIVLGAGATYMVMSHNRTTHVLAPAVPTQQSESVQSVIKKSLPSVVQVTVDTSSGQDLGTGFIYDNSGDIITNAHVVNGETSISVKSNSGQSYSGTLIGIDPVHDIALVRSPALAKVSPLPLGNSSSVSLGDSVVAIGNPLGLKDTVTTGVISGLNRSFTIGAGNYHNVFQISAPIAPGNSGGPLIEQSDGKVIGINTAGMETSGNIGFSIPINQIKSLVSQWAANPQSENQIQQAFNTDTSSNDASTSADGSGGNSTNTSSTSGDFAQSCLDALNTFYSDVTSQDYLDAYNLLGQKWQESTSYTTFASGYSTTTSAQVSDPVIESSSNNSAEITFSLTAQTQNTNGSGSTTVYHMDYTFDLEDGQVRIKSGTSNVVS